ncbi:MAG: hypothetical protein ACTSWQ_00775, partial [Candidatus Thorarchaeota archaeon]
ILSRGALSHPNLSLYTNKDGYFIRIITGTPGTVYSSSSNPSYSATNVTSGTATHPEVQDSYLRSVYYIGTHTHTWSHSHSFTINPYYRKYRAYLVTAPIYDLDELPVGSALIGYSSSGFPSGWTATTSTGRLIKIDDATISSTANGGVGTYSISAAATSTNGITGTTREYQTGSEKYAGRATNHGHSIVSHGHANSVSAYPQYRRMYVYERTS